MILEIKKKIILSLFNFLGVFIFSSAATTDIKRLPWTAKQETPPVVKPVMKARAKVFIKDILTKILTLWNNEYIFIIYSELDCKFCS